MRSVPRPAAALALALTLATATPGTAGWTSLGAMPPPQRAGNALVFADGRNVVSVTAITSEIVRVRFSPTPAFGRDHSWAVVAGDLGNPHAVVTVGTDGSTLATTALRVTIRHDPFRIAFATPAGESLDEDDPARGMAAAGGEVRVWKRLRDDEHVYGLGEKAGPLDKRGPQLQGSSYVMWNTDAYGYGDATDPLYVSVPFFMVVRAGRAHGIFLDNTFRTSFDIGHESTDRLSFGAAGGELNYYFIAGPQPKQVIERYTALTGRMPLPPLWSLGFHQCRYSYYPERKVRFIAESFRVRRIPADVIWLDIHYLDGFNPFTWDRTRFPDPAKLIGDLRAMGLRTVTIVDPHPKKQPGWPVYDSGRAADLFVTNPDGSDYEAPVWPAQADKDPGPSVFPDFSKPAARDWWGGLLKAYTDLGVAGIWNDMNEPAVFGTTFHTMPVTVRHDNEGLPTDHAEIHNVYGLEMTRATHEGLLRLRPDERPFILTRATFAGGQRYAAQWPGDNTANWAHLRASVAMLLGMGISGLPFVGSDIGGYAGAPAAELATRWLQLGVFYPFMRMHSEWGQPDKEPWAFGTRNEAVNRRAIELRYELLPEIYDAMREASVSGVPAMRPLFLDYPTDGETAALDDELLLGPDLLVAPVLREAATERWVYLPKGTDWYDFWTGARHEAGTWLRLPVTLESIPIFARAGAFVFRQLVVQHTGEMRGQPLIVDVYPAATAEDHHYEDDGESRAYLAGSFLDRRFTMRRTSESCTIEIGAAVGSYRPAGRDLILRVRGEIAPVRILLDGDALPRQTAGDGAAPGWRVDQGAVVVRFPDRWGAVTVRIEVT
jgi:alpha-glucosidase